MSEEREVAGDLLASLDPATGRHCWRVASLAGRIWRRLGQPHDVQVWLGFLLHDVGKCGLPAGLLDQTGPLTAAQWRLVHEHPLIGAELVAARGLPMAASVVVAHHERLDGRGYPFGLRGHAIPLAARVLAVADAFDAMTSKRPYAPALPAPDALAVLWACSGSQFAPQAVYALLGVVAQRSATAV